MFSWTLPSGPQLGPRLSCPESQSQESSTEEIRGRLLPALRPHRRAEERGLPSQGVGQGWGWAGSRRLTRRETDVVWVPGDVDVGLERVDINLKRNAIHHPVEKLV